MQEIFRLLHFAFLKLQNENGSKSFGWFCGALGYVDENVRFLPRNDAFCRMNGVEKDGRLWKNLLILLTTLFEKLEKQ